MKIGDKVQIRRSSGLSCEACISEIIPSQQLVAVHWLEGEESKGKKITFDNLLLFNPNLVIDEMEEASKEGGAKQTSETREVVGKGVKFPSMIPCSRRSLKISRAGESVGSKKEKKEMKELEDAIKKGFITSRRSVAPRASRKSVVSTFDKPKVEKRFSMRADISSVKRHEPLRVQYNNKFITMIEDYRKQLLCKPLSIADPVMNNRITVCVRVRPLNETEIARKQFSVVTVAKRDVIILHQPQTKVDTTKFLENQTFRFDYVFNESCNNDMVYQYTAKPLTRTIFEKGFATCFAYGQTGTGKTYTMSGGVEGKQLNVDSGIYGKTVQDIFHLLNYEYYKLNLKVSCCFFEIYGEKVNDLLNNKQPLKVLEDGCNEIRLTNLKEVVVDNEEDVFKLIKKGSDVRTSGQTSMNRNSSRSHAVFQIILRDKMSNEVHGKFSLVDLAGNERGADNISLDRQTRIESSGINNSLFRLKECIRAIGQKKTYVPFRTSKLTMVLRDSFVAENARTCMIAMISPGNLSCEHTSNTLQYANRVKELIVNELEVMGKVDDQEVEDDLEKTYDVPISSMPACLVMQLAEKERNQSNCDTIPCEVNDEEKACSLSILQTKLLEKHQFLLQNMKSWSACLQDLYSQNKNTKYDFMMYAGAVSALLTGHIKTMQQLQEAADEYLQLQVREAKED
ncbi:Kinesin-like protein KIF2A [Trichinella murrelli]|uniref:Kinesin-like protein n=1 Tax=Trichinella murrelli TaxID=144512 RepID=A0A0V0UBH0_9BILA|nr:Kinesin-like protein KIF2A [Trichinella murrelli]